MTKLSMAGLALAASALLPPTVGAQSAVWSWDPADEVEIPDSAVTIPFTWLLRDTSLAFLRNDGQIDRIVDLRSILETPRIERCAGNRIGSRLAVWTSMEHHDGLTYAAHILATSGRTVWSGPVRTPNDPQVLMNEAGNRFLFISPGYPERTITEPLIRDADGEPVFRLPAGIYRGARIIGRKLYIWVETQGAGQPQVLWPYGRSDGVIACWTLDGESLWAYRLNASTQKPADVAFTREGYAVMKEIQTDKMQAVGPSIISVLGPDGECRGMFGTARQGHVRLLGDGFDDGRHAWIAESTPLVTGRQRRVKSRLVKLDLERLIEVRSFLIDADAHPHRLVEVEPEGRVMVAFSRPRPDDPASWRLLGRDGEPIARWSFTSEWVWRTLPEWMRGPYVFIPAQAAADSVTTVVDLTR